jgi:DinB superfamily
LWPVPFPEDDVESVANDLLSALKIGERLRQIKDSEASIRPAPGKWSKKEILGHLIDSAANNHQRFVRLQMTSRLDLPGYDGDEWVRLQRYQDRSWSEIVDLWQMYNTHLAGVIRLVDPKALPNVWHMPDGKDVDLEFIIRDYVVHMRHHLDQIL